jgi:capsular exopolysaccharide synthesis family protein
MSRLREAFEKAAGRQSGGQSETSRAPREADEAQLPDEWDFDLKAVEARRSQVAAPETLEHETLIGPPPQVVRFEDVEIENDETDVETTAPPRAPVALTDRPPVVAQPRPRDAFWHTYRFGQKGLGKVVVGPDAESTLVEQYRRLGAALHHHQLQSGARTLMVTSAVAAEGKTLTATNLALTLSHSYQRRVLLVDADLRRPSIHEILRLPNTTGLSDSLRHPEQAGLRVHEISPNLSALTAGRADSDPMAGLVSDTMNRLLSEAAQQFDWVIVDTPPVALLPDANLLAAMIDTAVLVVSARATPYPLVRRAVEAIGQQRILGVVLNRMSKAEMVAAYSYYGYGAYAYGIAKRRGRGLMFWRRPKDVTVTTQERKSEAAAG